MRKIPLSMISSLFVAVFVLQAGLFAFSQEAQGKTLPTELKAPPQEGASSQGAVLVSLGKDSPSVGKDAFVTFSLSTVEAVNVGKITSEVSFPNNGQLAFDRAELTPDMKSSGAKLEVEQGAEGGNVTKLKVTLTGNGPILDGILCNLIFKVVNRPSGDKFAGEEQKIKLDNKASAWTTDGREIAIVTGEAGEVDFEYAPVVFACFFYMH